MNRPILIVSAGTGGHVFPAISLGETLLEKSERLFILTDSRAISYWPSTWKNIQILSIKPLQKSFKGILIFTISLITSFIHCCRLLMRVKPSVVVMFGGYPTLPALGAAILLNYPFVLHEQNAVVGRVNYFFSRFAKCLAYSWPETKNLPSHSSLKLKMTGLPVRKMIGRLHEHRYNVSRKDETFKILILGGSQGAQVFNALIPQAISLLPETLQRRLEIFHQCREEEIASVKAAYKKTPVVVELRPFFNDIPTLLSTMNFMISRSGASTLGEVATSGLPAVLIPYLYAKDDHQTANALNFANRGAAWIIPQSYFTVQRLKGILQSALEKPEVLLAASEALNLLKSHKASEALADLILNIVLTQNIKKRRTKVL